VRPWSPAAADAAEYETLCMCMCGLPADRLEDRRVRLAEPELAGAPAVGVDSCVETAGSNGFSNNNNNYPRARANNGNDGHNKRVPPYLARRAPAALAGLRRHINSFRRAMREGSVKSKISDQG
jgi:hypothetical protein